MRELIEALKDGVAVLNRDVTELEQDERIAVLEVMQKDNPDPELKWFWHACGEDGCTRKPITAPMPSSAHVVKEGAVIPKKEIVAPKLPVLPAKKVVSKRRK